MKNTLLTLSAAVLCAVICSGCSSFEYTGRIFDAHDDDTVIAWHTAQNPVPAGKYRVIGRGVLKFRRGDMDKYDVEERLLDEARSVGADAVLLGKTLEVGKRTNESDQSVDKARRAEFAPQTGVTEKGAEYEINALGASSSLQGAAIQGADCFVHAVFYKNSESVQKLIESQNVRIMDDKESK